MNGWLALPDKDFFAALLFFLSENSLYKKCPRLAWRTKGSRNWRCMSLQIAALALLVAVFWRFFYPGRVIQFIFYFANFLIIVSSKYFLSKSRIFDFQASKPPVSAFKISKDILVSSSIAFFLCLSPFTTK